MSVTSAVSWWGQIVTLLQVPNGIGTDVQEEECRLRCIKA